ncbi:MAG: hypothetical protein JWR90_1324 [Marmoricola sp.]|nr:hypothetical protein [Marmoricola sp.]
MTGEQPNAVYRVAWAVAALVAVGVLVLSLLVVLGRGPWLPGVADCTVEAGGRSVELSAQEAQSAASVAAGAVRVRASAARAERAVASVLDAPDADVRLVTAALTGRVPHALSCRHGGADHAESDRLDAAGLTGRTERVRRDLRAAFGPLKEGGFAPGGVRSGHMVGSAHYEGRAVDVFFRPVNRRNRTGGWATAQYLVAHAQRLEIDTVIFDARIWTARRADEGWRTYRLDTSGRSRQVAAILLHRDHVHVDVAG